MPFKDLIHRRPRLAITGLVLATVLWACIRRDGSMDITRDEVNYETVAGSPLLNGILVSVRWDGDTIPASDAETEIQFYGANPALPVLQARWLDLNQHRELTGCAHDIMADADERGENEVAVCDRGLRSGSLRSVACLRYGERRVGRVESITDVKPGVRAITVDCVADAGTMTAH